MAEGFLFDNKVFASSSGSKRCEKIMKKNYLKSTILPKICLNSTCFTASIYLALRAQDKDILQWQNVTATIRTLQISPAERLEVGAKNVHQSQKNDQPSSKTVKPVLFSSFSSLHITPFSLCTG